MSTSTDIAVDEKVKVQIPEPKQWKVIILNDDLTPMEFVIAVLIEVFKHQRDEATTLTMQVHETGSAVAGVYSFEIAEIKSVEATTLARAEGYPLQFKIEEEH